MFILKALLLTLIIAQLSASLVSRHPPFSYVDPSRNMPRLVVYQQTHHVTTNGIENYVSILPLLQSGASHVIIAAIHLNPGAQISLNDHHPQNERFNRLWQETRQLQAGGIKVMGMVGGAAQGSYMRLETEVYFLFFSILTFLSQIPFEQKKKCCL
jgi:hypothetical protein